MRRTGIVAFVAVILSSAALSAHAATTVRGGVIDLPPGTDLSNARVLVDGGEHISPIDASGHFVLPRLEAGSHVVDVSIADLAVPQVRVDVSDKAADRYRAVYNDGSNRVLVNAMTEASAADAAASAGTEYPILHVAPAGKLRYYVPREGFNPMSILKNPMVIMMVVSLGLVYVMPLIADQDEMRASMKDMQKTVNQASATPAVAAKKQH
jgi:hypothetical protein